MIGVFDSGYGGLTVLRALADRLPDRHFVYLGDHANAPYGNRPAEEIYGMTVASIDYLFARGCRLVILACNTASVSLRRVQQVWLAQNHPSHRVLGVVVPVIEVLTGLPWLADPKSTPSPRPKATVALFGTRHTVQSCVFPQEISKRAPQLTVEQMACPNLAALIEQGASRDVLRQCVHHSVGALIDRLDGRRLDAALLACTHYPLVADLFREAVPDGTELLSQPVPTAESLAAYLERHPDLDVKNGGGVTYHTTGDPKHVSTMASAFHGGRVLFSGV